MEIEFSINEFNNFIKSINYHKSQIGYWTNTIRIVFFSENDEKLYFFHIDPAWRIVLNDKIIINSYNYPSKEYNAAQRKQEENDFYEWCNKTNFMRNENIKNILVMDNCDLIIEWENGAILNSFVNDIEGPSYFFYDKVNYKVYDFMYRKIIQDDLKREKCGSW